MSKYTAGAWRYRKETDDTFTIYPAWQDWSNDVVLAIVLTHGISTAEHNARLMASAPELKMALVETIEVLRATEVFMCAQGLDTEELNEVIGIIEELLDRIDGQEEF